MEHKFLSGKYANQTMEEVLKSDAMYCYKLIFGGKQHQHKLFTEDASRYLYLLMIADNGKITGECKAVLAEKQKKRDEKKKNDMKKEILKAQGIAVTKHKPLVNEKFKPTPKGVYKTKPIDVTSEEYIFENGTVEEWNEYKRLKRESLKC